MPVYKDENAKKNKWYFTINYKENGKYKKILRRGFKTQKAAKEAMTEMENALNKGSYIEPSKVLYSEHLGKYLAAKKNNVKESTFGTYSYLVNKFIIPALGHIEISKIQPQHIEDLYNELKENNTLSDENIRKIHTLINDSMNRALKWEMIARNPATLVDPPKIAKKLVDVWDKEEIDKFLEAAKGSRYYEAFLLALTTGMRQSELLGLRFRDIDKENNTIAIVQTLSHTGQVLIPSTKSAASNRSISIDPETMSTILNLESKYKQEKMANRPLYKDFDLVIRTEVGTPLSPRNCLRAFNGVIKKAGVRKIRFHDLRHTHASLLLKQGVNPKIVSERLGHANVRITLDRYSHLLPNLQEDTAKQFGEIFYKTN